MRLLKLLTITSIALGELVCAQAPDIETITAASYENQLPAMETMLLSTDGISYENAYLKYRLATVYYGSGDSKRSDELLKNAIEELDKLLATTPDFAEALTLKGAAIGMRISFRPSIRGMTMGPASGRAISRALELDPANPRVWLIKGIAAHNTPALFGGGSKKALSALDQSITLYSDNGMGWGYADAYVWRGLTYLNRGDKDKARTDFQAALTIAPNFAWAGTLLEQLDLTVAAY